MYGEIYTERLDFKLVKCLIGLQMLQDLVILQFAIFNNKILPTNT